MTIRQTHKDPKRPTSDSAWVEAFAPASVANVACGFDVLGFALEQPGDVVAARRRDQPGVEIVEITGDGGRLPLAAERNTAGIAATRLLELGAATSAGLELRLEKRMPLGSGLGSSAASAVAAAVAVDALLDLATPRDVLLGAAVEGERVITGSAHADNAAGSLYGGFVLVRGSDVIELPVPAGLSCALVRPHVEIETGAARALLGDQVQLGAAVQQWGNVGALVAGLYRGDFELIASALHDAVAEPVRSPQVPGFAAIREAALAAGALGSSLSGSGPTVFALTADLATAERAAAQMAAALARTADIECDVYISAVGVPGARVIEVDSASPSRRK